jgi:nicotinate phosphoribosyltransferase
MPEGTVFFPGEPVLQVRAPLVEAQILETYLLAMITFQSMIATKASRVAMAARKRPVVDFGSRRAHGPEAALYAARASFIGGVDATSNVEAGKLFGIPVAGTCAHSWVQSFESEEESFRAFNEVFPEHSILLIDTYDTLEGARLALKTGKSVKGVRIDSGDLARLAVKVRAILDEGGGSDLQIVASSDLNEYKIDDMVREGAPIDMFGVGTDMVTSSDAPNLGAVYKLVETETAEGVHFKIKLSRNKITYPGRKQILRRYGTSGQLYQDVISCADENPGRDGRALLEKVIEGGRLLRPHRTVAEVREYAKREIATIPDRLRKLRGSHEYQVLYSAQLESRLREERHRGHHPAEPND